MSTQTMAGTPVDSGVKVGHLFEFAIRSKELSLLDRDGKPCIWAKSGPSLWMNMVTTQDHFIKMCRAMADIKGLTADPVDAPNSNTWRCVIVHPH